MLAGLRIIEGSAFVAAPYAGMTLAQMGAEVIRFDLPGGGLDYRRMPREPRTGRSYYWAGLNKGKKSVTIDFRKPEGAELVRALVTAPGEGGGVLLTNFAGADWLDHGTLKRRRSDLISLEISGNFDGGSEVDYTVNPAVGIPSITGPTGEAAPVNSVIPTWDLTCGLQAANAILAAVLRRRQTGQGARMSLALSDMGLSIVSHLGMLAEAEAGVQRPAIGNDVYGGFGRDFVAADRERVMIVCLTLKQWRAFGRATGLAPAFAELSRAAGVDLDDEETRFQHRAAIAGIVAPWFAQRDLSDVAALFAGTGVCWSRYQTLAGLLADDRRATDANPMWHEVDHPGLGPLRTPSSPVAVADEPGALPRAAPDLGADTEAVLTDVLGCTDREISDLAEKGIIAVGGRVQNAL